VVVTTGKQGVLDGNAQQPRGSNGLLFGPTREQHGELGGVEAGKGIAFAHGVLQTICNILAQPVGHSWAVPIVDGRGLIQAEVNDSDLRNAACAAQNIPRPPFEFPAVKDSMACSGHRLLPGTRIDSPATFCRR
jgi:hypothetical protein